MTPSEEKYVLLREVFAKTYPYIPVSNIPLDQYAELMWYSYTPDPDKPHQVRYSIKKLDGWVALRIDLFMELNVAIQDNEFYAHGIRFSVQGYDRVNETLMCRVIGADPTFEHKPEVSSNGFIN